MRGMEPDTPVKGKKRTVAAKKSTTRKGLDASAASSAHVIDLRTHSKTAVVTPPKPEPEPVEKPKPASKKKPEPVEEPEASKPDNAPVVQPIAPQDGDLVPGETVDIVKVQSGKKRFWGAFFRFILLLIVLGGLVFGGVYLYLSLYQK